VAKQGRGDNKTDLGAAYPTSGFRVHLSSTSFLPSRTGRSEVSPDKLSTTSSTPHPPAGPPSPPTSTMLYHPAYCISVMAAQIEAHALAHTLHRRHMHDYTPTCSVTIFLSHASTRAHTQTQPHSLYYTRKMLACFLSFSLSLFPPPPSPIDHPPCPTLFPLSVSLSLTHTHLYALYYRVQQGKKNGECIVKPTPEFL